ncbi:restriction endonuclease subunit S [Nitrosomonas halophila]|uniref:Type I restriction enzyme, S subunit n=1 Tax=Nitrosomonas halophila TaxID=44576 RepID=A0A1H3KZL5_9PROT|nr:restriction endonuclease subunit S [Nitrosomonas halophila]SDY57601.1 type I restriction enzyme, S subunit [Nitrosomonas halophila]
MRVDWAFKPLGEICNVVGGGTPSKHNPAFYEGDIPWATVRDMRDEILSRTEFKISPEAVKSSATNVIPLGNVVIATRVGLGKVCLLSQATAINQDLRGIIPKSKNLDVRFLFRWLQSVSHIIEAEGTGTTVKGVKLPFVKSLKMPLPPLPEQKRIVTILDEAFAGIATAVANTEKNLANARELFESYLNSVFSQRGEGWVDLTLKEVCKDYGRGKSKHRPRNDPKLYGGAYPFIQTGDVRNSDHLIREYSVTYNEVGLAQSKLWPKGTICITIAANIAETGILDFDACFPDSIIGLVVDEAKASSAYVEFLLQSVRSILKAKGKGSAQDNINLATFENEKFPFPSLEMQLAIAGSLQEIRSAVRQLEFIYQQKLNALAELKQSLLQKAFSGELTADKDTSDVIRKVEEVA